MSVIFFGVFVNTVLMNITVVEMLCLCKKRVHVLFKMGLETCVSQTTVVFHFHHKCEEISHILFSASALTDVIFSFACVCFIGC